MGKKFRTKKDLPKLILREKTFSPKILRNIILKEYNVEMTPQNINMWLSRHSEIVKDLKKKIEEEDAQHETIRFDIDYWITKDFKSSIPIVQKWIDTMITRKVSIEPYGGEVRKRVLALRKICMGLKGRGKKAIRIMDWSLHPLALTEDKAMQFIVELTRLGFNDKEARLAIRNFLKYGKREEPAGISGDKGESGKYAHLYIPKELAHKILNWIMEKDPLIGSFCWFLYKTATRADATKNIKLSHVKLEERITFVWDKGKKRKKQKWKKYMDDQLVYIMEPLMEKGILWNDIDLTKARELCWKAYEKFIPELVTRECFKCGNKYLPSETNNGCPQCGHKKFKADLVLPLHFWRHEYAQAMLRATGWNYDVTAKLGGWHPQTLRENYGEPPESVIRKAGLKCVPMI